MAIDPIHIHSSKILKLEQPSVKEQLKLEAVKVRAGIGNEYKVPCSTGNISVWDTQTPGKKCIVFIHGNSASKETFVNQYKSSLAEEYRLIAIDLPGHGESDDAADPDAHYNLNSYSQVVRDVVNYLDISNYSIFGWSLGGHVAIETLDDEKLESIMISGTPPIPFSPEGFGAGFYQTMNLDLLPEQLKKLGAQDLQPLLSKNTAFDEEQARAFHAYGGMDTFDDENLKFLVLAGQRTDGLAREKCLHSFFTMGQHDQAQMVLNSEKPVIAFQGANDAGAKTSYIKDLMGDKCIVIPEAGHGFIYTHSETLNQKIKEFMK